MSAKKVAYDTDLLRGPYERNVGMIITSGLISDMEGTGKKMQEHLHTLYGKPQKDYQSSSARTDQAESKLIRRTENGEYLGLECSKSHH